MKIPFAGAAMMMALMSAACGGTLSLSSEGTTGAEGGTGSAETGDAGGDAMAVEASCSNVIALRGPTGRNLDGDIVVSAGERCP